MPATFAMNVTARPLWIAYVVTPLATPLAFFVVYFIYFHAMGYDRAGLSWPGALLFMYVFGVPVGYVAIGALGRPWINRLIRWRKLSWGYVCAGACVIGAVALPVAVGLLNDVTTVEPGWLAGQLAMGLAMGLLAGVIFCAVAGVPAGSRRKPVQPPVSG